MTRFRILTIHGAKVWSFHPSSGRTPTLEASRLALEVPLSQLRGLGHQHCQRVVYYRLEDTQPLMIRWYP